MTNAYCCSVCKNRVEHDGPPPDLYPFCSERCKLIDLGRWFNEQYTIDRDLAPEDVGDVSSSEYVE